MDEREGMKKGWLWIGAIFIPALFVADAFLYYPALLRSGTLDPNADSIGIPVGMALIASPIFVILLSLYALPALWRYRDNARFFEWDRSAPWRMAVSFVLYGIPAVLIVGERLYALSQVKPYYEYFDSIFVVPLFLWVLMLRAAMAAPRSKQDAAT